MIEESYNKWRTSLQLDEQQIVEVAEQAHERIVKGLSLTGSCYLLAFFLHQYLKKEKAIPVEIVVGWLNDGISPIMISHAWIEYKGRKTDIALTQTEFSKEQLPGDLIILDRIIQHGKITYAYSRERSIEALNEILALREQFPKEVAQKENEHILMKALSQDEIWIQRYLDDAPQDRNYDALARLMSETK